jgi:hypothetical protein
MGTWTAERWLAGSPAEILELLSEPEAIAEWSPVRFELLGLDGERLEAGSRARVRGELAGRGVEFEVIVEEADEEAFSVRGQGLVGRALAHGVDVALSGGALPATLGGLARALQRRGELAYA